MRQHYPLLAQACHVVANIRIRNMATIGGNLAHADSQSDPPAALVALDASVELTKRDSVAHRQARRLFTRQLRDRVWSAMKYSPHCGCRRRRRMPRHLPQIYHALIGGSSLRRRCGVGAVVNGSVAEARVVVGAVSPAPVVLTQKDFASAQRFER